MRHFLVKSEDVTDSKLVLRHREAEHAFRVLRMKKGDTFTAVNGSGRKYISRIVSLSGKKVDADILEVLDPTGQKKTVFVTTAMALCKGTVVEYVLQKATEMGAGAFVLFAASRSITRTVSTAKKKRWETIIREAVKQSGRTTIPSLEIFGDFSSVKKYIKGHDVAVIPSIIQGGEALREVLKRNGNFRRVFFMIGPEGDFTSEEVSQAESAGCCPVSLGDNTLRSDTAALYVLANIL